jgi:hypothetical protein
MGLDAKARRRQATEISGAPLHLKDAVAGAAAEMVMVPQVRELVPRGLARELNRDRGPFFYHGA